MSWARLPVISARAARNATRAITMAAGAGWSYEETRTLVGIWAAADVQRQLDGVLRNKVIYEKIAASLSEAGYERTWQQCKTKMKNLIKKYKKVS